MDADVPLAPLAEAKSARALFRGQLLHVLAIAALVPVAGALAAPALDARSRPWFVAALALPIVHQVVVWLGWRLQLGWGVFTRAFGRRDLAVWCALFHPLLLARPALLIGLALADRGSLAIAPRTSLVLGLGLLFPAAWVGVTVAREWGFVRPTGSDHFRRSVSTAAPVRVGPYRWTPNAMYVFAFLGLWSIALLARSHAALVAALFQHAYIGVHFLCTERPDMELIHGSRAGSSETSG